MALHLYYYPIFEKTLKISFRLCKNHLKEDSNTSVLLAHNRIYVTTHAKANIESRCASESIAPLILPFFIRNFLICLADLANLPYFYMVVSFIFGIAMSRIKFRGGDMTIGFPV